MPNQQRQADAKPRTPALKRYVFRIERRDVWTKHLKQ